jgi:hypothetical protein
MVRHSAQCKGGVHSDAAKRMSDTYRLHRVGLGPAATGRWFAVRLADGTGDGTLYDTKRDAVRHAGHNEQLYAFVCISPGDMDVCDAEDWLTIHRTYYDAGLRMPDPDHVSGGPDVVARATREDQFGLMRSIKSRGRIRPSGLVYPGE